MTKANRESEKYQKMYEEVENLVSSLESSSLNLDDLVEKLEHGYDLISKMKSRLNDTKLKVEQINGEQNLRSTESNIGNS